jgi:hypothetical protein
MPLMHVKLMVAADVSLVSCSSRIRFSNSVAVAGTWGIGFPQFGFPRLRCTGGSKIAFVIVTHKTNAVTYFTDYRCYSNSQRGRFGFLLTLKHVLKL